MVSVNEDNRRGLVKVNGQAVGSFPTGYQYVKSILIESDAAAETRCCWLKGQCLTTLAPQQIFVLLLTRSLPEALGRLIRVTQMMIDPKTQNFQQRAQASA